MSRRIGDAWLWVGISVTLFIGLGGVSRLIIYLGEDAEPGREEREEPRHGYAMVEKVDDINLESLKVLSTCQNVNIRRSATRLVLDRFAADPSNWTQFAHDLMDSSASDEERHRAWNAKRLMKLCQYSIPGHLLVSMTEEQRDLASKLFPHDEMSGMSRSTRGSGDVFGQLGPILDGSSLSIERLEQLVNSFPAEDDQDHLTADERQMVNMLRDRLDHAIHGARGEGARPRPRVNEETPEETARRRRRREAMVLNEGDRPLSQADIIQRRRTGESTAFSGARQGAQSNGLDGEVQSTWRTWLGGWAYAWA